MGKVQINTDTGNAYLKAYCVDFAFTKTRLKNLPDNSKFKLSEGSSVFYRLQSLDHKKRMAMYTSEVSQRTYKAGWNKEVYV